MLPPVPVDNSTREADPLAGLLYDAPTVRRALGCSRVHVWRLATALGLPARYGRQGRHPRPTRYFTGPEFASLVAYRASLRRVTLIRCP